MLRDDRLAVPFLSTFLEILCLFALYLPDLSTYFGNLCSFYAIRGFLVSFARVAVGEIDRAAVGEAVAGEDVMHYDIILVGVDPDAVRIGECPVEKRFCGIVSGFNSCYAVNYIIRVIV